VWTCLNGSSSIGNSGNATCKPQAEIERRLRGARVNAIFVFDQ
jgi:hypothetical protein